jgi:hypothetical protein
MTTQEMLDERYGRTRRPGTRWVLFGAVAVAIIAVGAFAWMTIANSLSAVDADTTGFTIVDEHSVIVEFQMSAPVGATIACVVEAQDEGHGIVGWKVVEIDASDSRARAFRETVPTIAEATTGFVNSCWVT